MKKEQTKKISVKELATLGGKAIFKKLGKKGMSKLGEKGAEARWGKIDRFGKRLKTKSK